MTGARYWGWVGGILISLAVLAIIPGQQEFAAVAGLGAGCSLLGYLIGLGAEPREVLVRESRPS